MGRKPDTGSYAPRGHRPDFGTLLFEVEQAKKNMTKQPKLEQSALSRLVGEGFPGNYKGEVLDENGKL